MEDYKEIDRRLNDGDDVFKSNEELAEEARAVKVGCASVIVGMLMLAAIAYWIFG